MTRLLATPRAHHFAKALLKRAKTDAVDARTLAQRAALLQPTPWTPSPAIARGYAAIARRLARQHGATTPAMRAGMTNARDPGAICRSQPRR